MEQAIEWLEVASDECDTLRYYTAKLDKVDEIFEVDEDVVQ